MRNAGQSWQGNRRNRSSRRQASETEALGREKGVLVRSHEEEAVTDSNLAYPTHSLHFVQIFSREPLISRKIVVDAHPGTDVHVITFFLIKHKGKSDRGFCSW